MNNHTFSSISNNAENIKKCKKIVITGGVGVGKTTTIEGLKQMLNAENIPFKVVPEYLQGDIHGREMLDGCLNKTISTFDFQYYILNFYDIFLENLDVVPEMVLIFERIPDDSVTCFANKANKDGKITNSQLFTLYEYSVEIATKYNLPSYFTINSNNENSFSIVKSDDTEKIVSQVFHDIVKNDNKKISLICLYNTPEECFARIHKRGIISEIENYKLEDVRIFNKHYTKLYGHFMNGDVLRFCDIGRLM